MIDIEKNTPLARQEFLETDTLVVVKRGLLCSVDNSFAIFCF